MGHTKSNAHGVDVLLETIKLAEFTKGLSFTNLVILMQFMVIVAIQLVIGIVYMSLMLAYQKLWQP